MILVTGGTGFIGRALILHLVEMGLEVRTLLRPSLVSPGLPRGVPIEAVICGLKDERGLRAALKGVDVIFHLAGAERKGSQADLTGVDIEGTQSLARVAAESGVDRFFYLSHLGADRASAYDLLKAKGIAESHIINSGIKYTIIRSALVYGPNDQFSTILKRMLKISPGVFLLPGDGNTLIQPLWIDDLVACLGLALDDLNTTNRIISVGGPEQLPFRQVIEILCDILHLRRSIVPVSSAYLRIMTAWIESFTKNFPLSAFWLDYLAANRICDLDTLPRLFGLIPTRFGRQMDYLIT